MVDHSYWLSYIIPKPEMKYKERLISFFLLILIITFILYMFHLQWWIFLLLALLFLIILIYSWDYNPWKSGVEIPEQEQMSVINSNKDN